MNIKYLALIIAVVLLSINVVNAADKESVVKVEDKKQKTAGPLALGLGAIILVGAVKEEPAKDCESDKISKHCSSDKAIPDVANKKMK